MTMPGSDGGRRQREEVGPVTYMLPLPTHTRPTESGQEESGRGRAASQIGSESEWPPSLSLSPSANANAKPSLVRPSLVAFLAFASCDNAVEQSYNDFKEAALPACQATQSLRAHLLVTRLFIEGNDGLRWGVQEMYNFIDIPRSSVEKYHLI